MPAAGASSRRRAVPARRCSAARYPERHARPRGLLPPLPPVRRLPRRLPEPRGAAGGARPPRRVLPVRERQAPADPRCTCRQPARVPEGGQCLHDGVRQRGILSAMRAPAAEPLTLLAILRLTLGAMFVWVFFENLGKDIYTPAGYAGLIRYYIEKGSAPLAWQAVMGFMAGHAAIVAPLQATAEPGFGVPLVLGLASRAAALAAFGFLTSLRVSEWGTAC